MQRAAEAKLTPSPELRCAARETARLYTENAAFPDPGLRAFLLARCGSTLPRASLRAVAFADDAARSDAELLTSVSGRLDTLLAGVSQGAVGLAFARSRGRGSVMLYAGKPGVTLEDFSPVVSGDTVSLHGYELGGAQRPGRRPGKLYRTRLRRLGRRSGRRDPPERVAADHRLAAPHRDGRWRCQPYPKGGKPTPFCYTTRYRMK